ncbi:MAG: mechanosensitive ion channel family protein, partial [Bacteroides sp.]
VILLFRPYKVGDYIDAQGVSGTVREIQIFHTVISTPDNKEIFIPNGSLSSGVITNVNSLERRRAEWLVAVEYGVPYDEVVRAFTEIVDADERILKDSAPSIVLKELGDNGVIYRVRAWVNTPDYWDVFFDINKKIYADFNEKGIGFPFPQLTIHKGDA